MSATWVTFLFEAANFVLLAAVLGWLFFRPVRDALERRRAEIESDQGAAGEARAAAERALQEARAQRAGLESSLAELRERVRSEAGVEREQLIQVARDQTQREREALKADLVSIRRAQARSLARDAALAAREIVVRLLEQTQGPELERALLAAACRELEELGSSGRLAPVVIESMAVLDADAVGRIAGAAGVTAADVTHRVDPDLVAGVRVLTARGLVDASAAGMAAQAERVLVSQLDRESADHG